ncbi:MAG: ABC transporter ATP-binding protein [Steroidobacteraceae bacterium]
MTALPQLIVADGSPLHCDGIVKRFSGSKILDGVTLKLKPGSIYGLLGRNGAGKTTLIHVLLGLLLPDAGTATVLGDPSLAMTDSSKTALGYVPQQPDALGWMRVGDMLEFVGGFYSTWDRSYVDSSLLRWSINPSRVLAKLSPGERQCVALIRALAICPRLLVLDEPAAALDPVARRELLRELAVRAVEGGTTVLLSTHIVSDLERVASHVACLHRHKLIIDAPMDDLKETHALVQLGAEAAARLARKVPGELSRRRRDDGGQTLIVVREPGADWPAVAREPEARLEVPGLEDLFIELTA